MAVQVLLLEVKQGSVRDDFGCKVGPGHAAPLHGDFHRALHDGKLASFPDRRLQAIGERSGQRRDLRRLGDADRLIAFQPDGQVQPRQGHELRLGGGVELLEGLRPLNLGPQDSLALDDALALVLASIRRAPRRRGEGRPVRSAATLGS